MKQQLKSPLILLVILSLLTFNSSAQFYSSGDITINAYGFGNHSAAQCSSMGSMIYDITISNSQLGDVFKLNYPGLGGYNILTTTNTTGASTWTINYNDMISISPDQILNNTPGYAYFFFQDKKAIITHVGGNQLAQDTLHLNNVNFSLYVPDPCTYQSISGKAYYDENSNCLFDAGDINLNGVYITAQSNVGSGGDYTNTSGDFSATLQETNLTSYTVSLPSNYQFIYQSTSCAPVSYTSTVLPETGFDFSLQCEDIDLYASGNGPWLAEPNIPFNVYAGVGNIGCTPASGILKLKLDPRVVYSPTGSTNLPASIISSTTGDTLVWNFSNLSSLSNGAYWNAFISRIKVTPLTSVAIGDVLHFSYTSTIPLQDVNTSNNQGSFYVTIATAYDPNFKEVQPKGLEANGYIASTTEELNYTIHFQNSGTASAHNIYVIDTLDTAIDPKSLHIELTSHLMNPVWLAPNVVKFHFPSIELPHEAANEAGSHGMVSFKVRLNPGVPVGTVIKNRGFIYFDYNAPIITDYATSTLAIVPSISTNPVSGVGLTDVNLFAEITEEGGAPIIEKGFCLSTSPLPTLLNTVVLNTDNSSVFSSVLNTLTESTVYYVRAFATNIMGTTYGTEVSFETLSSSSLESLSLTKQMFLYPNPTDGFLTLQSTYLLKSAKIIGMDGKYIDDVNLAQGENILNVSTLRPGVYMLEVETDLGYFNRMTFTKK
jgi:uncharacterized repeat protein (TIGR01451 family)